MTEQHEYRFSDKKLVFSRILTESELSLSEFDLKALGCYINEVPFEQRVVQIYSIDDTLRELERYKDASFNSDGLTALLRTETLLSLSGATVNDSLPLAMIAAVHRWLNALYLRQFQYKKQLENGEFLELINYQDIVAPCSFRDIQWVLDADFRMIDTERVVNTDINYYLNITY
jgi:hypothetical protein